jgi:short-subunit dehydrogenase
MATLLAAVPIMMARSAGHLVAISSLAGRRALPESAAYCASKAALSVFLESLRIDLAGAGIRVTDVQPGFVATEAVAQGNRPRPFEWPAEKAARVIARRLERAPRIVAFPWPLVLATGLGRRLPGAIYERILRGI